MKISSIQFSPNYKSIKASSAQAENLSFKKNFTYEDINLNYTPHYISFKKKNEQNTNDPYKYWNKRTQELKESHIRPSILYYDLNKLDGIQKDIKVFEGLTLKEIVFVLSTLTEIATLRGCYNNCAHCYAEAKPPIKEKDNYISRMDWEDFKDLTDGIKELQKRLGFTIKVFEREYMTLFHDADCSQIYIKDSKGKIHDWEEMAKKVYKITRVGQLFDTSGWYLQDKRAQERVEKYVKSIIESENNNFVYKVNISINPFQAMYFKAVEAQKEGNKEKEKFFRKKDAQRMTNTLFTLTPLISTGKVCLLPRAMDPNTINAQGYSSEDLKQTYKNVYFKMLKSLYKDDLNTNKKVIKSEEDIKNNLKFLKTQLQEEMDSNLTIINKLKKIYKKNSYEAKKTKKMILKDPKLFLEESSLDTIIDANGDIYITNFTETYKTDLKLNFKNKNKKTNSIAPNLCKKTITKKMIENKIDELYLEFN